jgi:osmotically-inducible protein OsmY
MRILSTVLIMVPLACMAYGSASTTALLETNLAFAGDKNKAPVNDDSITDQVRMRLAGDSDVKGGGIDVLVKDGVVTLKGQVDTDRARSKAEKLAKHVKGVHSVVNELTLRE